MFAVQLARSAPAPAVIGLGQIGEFEISREGLGDLVGAWQVHPSHNFLSLAHELRGRGLLRIAPRRLPMFDQQAPQLFHRREQLPARLLHQHLPEDCAQRAHVAPQGIILRRLVGIRDQFGQARLLVVGFPQRVRIV